MRILLISAIILLQSCASSSKQDQDRHDIDVCVRSVIPLIQAMGGNLDKHSAAMYCMQILDENLIKLYQQYQEQKPEEDSLTPGYLERDGNLII